jgi:hypothetical protein
MQPQTLMQFDSPQHRRLRLQGIQQLMVALQ